MGALFRTSEKGDRLDGSKSFGACHTNKEMAGAGLGYGSTFSVVKTQISPSSG